MGQVQWTRWAILLVGAAVLISPVLAQSGGDVPFGSSLPPIPSTSAPGGSAQPPTGSGDVPFSPNLPPVPPGAPPPPAPPGSAGENGNVPFTPGLPPTGGVQPPVAPLPSGPPAGGDVPFTPGLPPVGGGDGSSGSTGPIPPDPVKGSEGGGTLQPNPDQGPEGGGSWPTDFNQLPDDLKNQAAPAANPDVLALERILTAVFLKQKDALVKITKFRGTTDSNAQGVLLGEVQRLSDEVDAKINGSECQDLITKLKGEDPKAAFKDYRYLRIFGGGGRLFTIQKTQVSIHQFLQEKGVGSQYGGPDSGSDSGTGGKGSAVAGPTGSGTAPGGTGQTVPGGGGASSAGATAAGPVSVAPPGPGAPAPVTVPNSYGVAPSVMSDDQIRAFLDPLIDLQVAQENARSKTPGMVMNKYRQWIGTSGKTTIKSAGRPDGDHYREWLKVSPELQGAVNRHAQTIYDSQVKVTIPAPAAAPPAGADPTATSQPQSGSGR